MKAVIMAGGDGTRLRPLSANKPKPMVELLDKPVLEHILELLKRHGVTEACLTLKYLPQLVTDYFGNGEKFGMRLDYRIEKEALGTAGGVLNCADFLSQGGAEDFLVISGDCYCDFDLGALAAFHKEKGAEATLGLYSHPEPCGIRPRRDGGGRPCRPVYREARLGQRPYRPDQYGHLCAQPVGPAGDSEREALRFRAGAVPAAARR